MFRVGEKVICVNDKAFIFALPKTVNFPVKGEIYTIRNVCCDSDGCGLLLEEIVNPKIYITFIGEEIEQHFWDSRFRRLVDQKKIEELLTTAPKETENA